MQEFTPLQVSALKEVANIGLGHAATALSCLTGRTFHLSVPSVESITMDQLPGLLGGYESLTVSVFMPFEGDVQGDMAFFFPWAGARALWGMILGSSPSDLSQVGEIEASAMVEVGNIINSSFLNAISDMTGLAMHATVPALGIEMAGSLVSEVVVNAELSDAVAIAIETRIFDDVGETDGYFICIPTKQALGELFTQLGVAGAA